MTRPANMRGSRDHPACRPPAASLAAEAAAVGPEEWVFLRLGPPHAAGMDKTRDRKGQSLVYVRLAESTSGWISKLGAKLLSQAVPITLACGRLLKCCIMPKPLGLFHSCAGIS